MHLALYQGPSPSGDVERAFTIIEERTREAAERGASLIVFPELFLPGYNIGANHHDLAQPLDGPWVKRLSSLARHAGCGIVTGFSERDGRSVYNSAVVLGHEGGLVSRYRKIQLYGEMENTLFSAGASYSIFDWNGVTTGILICYDVEFPEHVRALRRMGVRLVLVPTANMAPFTYVSRVIVPSRAIENSVGIAYANYCGSERDLTYVGESVMAAGDGEPVEKADADSETVLVADLNALRGDPRLLSSQFNDLTIVSTPL